MKIMHDSAMTNFFCRLRPVSTIIQALAKYFVVNEKEHGNRIMNGVS